MLVTVVGGLTKVVCMSVWVMVLTTPSFAGSNSTWPAASVSAGSSRSVMEVTAHPPTHVSEAKPSVVVVVVDSVEAAPSSVMEVTAHPPTHVAEAKPSVVVVVGVAVETVIVRVAIVVVAFPSDTGGSLQAHPPTHEVAVAQGSSVVAVAIVAVVDSAVTDVGRTWRSSTFVFG